LADSTGPTRSASHGILDLDNNAAERGMRAVALGRKNYLFVGSEAGGKAAAIAYTVIETAKLNAIDPHAWLADTLGRIPDYEITKVDDLLAWRWDGYGVMLDHHLRLAAGLQRAGPAKRPTAPERCLKGNLLTILHHSGQGPP
jgi:hypothetical protein